MASQHLAHLKFHGYIGVHIHDSIVVPPPVPCKLVHIALDVLQGLFINEKPSIDIFTNSIEPSYGMGGIPFMGRLTDAGFIVPHLSIPMNNPLLILTILFGGSISLLGSSSVKVRTHNPVPLLGDTEDSDMGAVVFPQFPLSLNLACSDPIPLPTDFVISPDNVLVGITAADWIAALVDLAIEVALAVVMSAFGSGFDALKKAKGGSSAATEAASAASGPIKSATRAGQKEIADQAAQEVAEKAGREASEKALKESAEEAGDSAVKTATREAAENAGEAARKQALEEGAESVQREAQQKAIASTREAAEAGAPVAKRADIASKAYDAEAARLTKELAKEGDEAYERALKEAMDEGLDESAEKAAREAGEDSARKLAEKEGRKASNVARQHAFDTPTRWKVATYTWEFTEEWGKSFGGSIDEAVGKAISGEENTRLSQLAGEGFAGMEGTEDPATIAFHPDTQMSSADVSEGRANAPVTIDVHFSKPVTGFTSGDIRASNGSVGCFASTGSQDYSFTVTPQGNGAVSASIGAAVCFYEEEADHWWLSGAKKKYPNRSARFDFDYNSDRPTVVLECMTPVTNQPQFGVTARFNMDVQGFDASKVSVSAGTVENFQPVDAKEYQFVIDTGGAQGDVTVNVAENAAHTRYGNGNHAAAPLTVSVDTIPPTVSITRKSGPISSSSRVKFDVTFSEDVVFGTSNLQARRGDDPLAIANFVEKTKSSYTVFVDAGDPGEVELIVPEEQVADLAGNVNAEEARLVVLYHPMGALHPDSTELQDLPPEDQAAMQEGAAVMGEEAAL